MKKYVDLSESHRKSDKLPLDFLNDFLQSLIRLAFRGFYDAYSWHVSQIAQWARWSRNSITLVIARASIG
jgi:hypothetical protein